jgi:hypothetical protein
MPNLLLGTRPSFGLKQSPARPIAPLGAAGLRDPERRIRLPFIAIMPLVFLAFRWQERL